MPKVVPNDVLDFGLQRDLTFNRIYVCAGEPISFANIAARTLADAALAAPALGAGSPDGRQVNYAAVSGVAVATSGTADHVVYGDTVNSRYVVTTCAPTALTAGPGNTVAVAANSRRIGAVT